ncbi:unnamed protein product [Penicillium viridicatum]
MSIPPFTKTSKTPFLGSSETLLHWTLPSSSRVRRWISWMRTVREEGTVERGIETNLSETDVGGLLTEALTADVHLKPAVLATQVHVTSHIAIRNMLEGSVSPYSVLADQTGAVGADTAEGARILASPFL